MAKNPSAIEVYNDLHSGLVCFYRVLRDPKKFKEFMQLIEITPYAREEFYYCRDGWGQTEDEIERARMFYLTVHASFCADCRSFGTVVTTTSRNMAAVTSKYLSSLDRLPKIHARLRTIQIEHQDFRIILQRYDTIETLFYCDPPYIHDTRRSKNNYAHEMTNDDHKELVSVLLNLNGKVILSGYKHEIYLPLEEYGWQRIEWPISCSAAGRTRANGILGDGAAIANDQIRLECVWINPQGQLAN